MKKILFFILALLLIHTPVFAQSADLAADFNVKIPQIDISALPSLSTIFPGFMSNVNLGDLQNAIKCASTKCSVSETGTAGSQTNVPLPEKKPTENTNTQIVTKTLKQGSFNLQVFRLQDFLATKGYFASVPTGYFGAKTTLAVQQYQTANNLEADGIVGPKTQASINSSLAK